MTSAATVLILDGQTNQALACARSLGRAGHKVLVASHLRWPLAAWSRHSNGRLRIGGETLSEFRKLRQKAAALGVDWVLPLTERACMLCNLERSEWERAGIGLGCASEEVLNGAFDKFATGETAICSGVNVPTTRLPTSLESAREAARELGYPCVIKPRFSNYWTGSRFLPNRSCAYVASSDDLERQILSRRQGEHWPLIQSYVPGIGKGVFALCDRGRPVAWFAHQRLRDVRPTGSGSSLRKSVSLDPRLRLPAERLLAEMQWHGPAMVEFRDDGSQSPWLMEVNGRFWTSLELAIQAGVDFPRLWLDILTEHASATVEEYRTEIILRWVWGDMKRLLYVMAGRPRGYTGAFPSRGQGFREIFGAQPPGTMPEIWQRDDPWPAVAEWLQGAREIFSIHGR